MRLPDNPNIDISFDKKSLREIYLAGGCFWGVDAYMRRVPGVASTQAGYANGTLPAPTYEQVCTGRTGHAEAVKVLYDPTLVSAAQLAQRLFSIIDPTSKNRQANDVGSQYRTGVYLVEAADLPPVRAVFDQEQGKRGEPIATELCMLTCFYPAEAYHQDYLEKNPNGYCHIAFDSL